MQEKSIALIIPVCNEEKILIDNITKLQDYVETLTEKYEVVFIENGSTDNTKNILEKLSEKDENIRFLEIEKKDLGLALKEGFLNAKNQALIWYPIDLSFNFSYMEESLKLLDDFDIIVGSKEMVGSTQKRPFLRKILSKIYNTLIRVLFQLKITDTQSVKTFKREAILPVLHDTLSEGIVFEVELLYNAKKNGLSIKEIPVHVTDLRKTSKINRLVVVKAFINLFTLKWNLLKR